MEVPRNPKPSKVISSSLYIFLLKDLTGITLIYFWVELLQIIGRLILIAVLVVVSCSREVVGRRGHNGWHSFDYSAISCRRFTACLTDFGGVGDGVTLNTDVFRTAVDFLSGFGQQGGSMLYVPPGKWLTGSFNLTSHFTLFLDQDAVILASQDENEYPVIEPLPSYGRVRDTQGGRFISLIFGTNLTDVIITGNNGTLDGQGSLWWDKFHNRTLNYTRPYLIEIMYSENIQISNLTLLNSPSWNVHPVYSSDIIIEGITIIAPTRSRNTDGINPDSCINTRIQDCYIVSGDDCIAVKSGWDEYGIAFGMPTKHLVIRRVTCISPTRAVIALGSEMSGGIEDVRAEDIVAINTESSVRIKTGVGRGGYVKDIYVRRVTMKTMKYVFWMTGNYGSHPDDKYDPNAFPVIKNINYRDMVAENVTMAGRLDGISGDPFTGICISNVTIEMGQHAMLPWNCTDISGVSSGVVPQPCWLLPDQGPDKVTSCDFPTETLPIENVEVQTCAFRQKLRNLYSALVSVYPNAFPVNQNINYHYAGLRPSHSGAFDLSKSPACGLPVAVRDGISGDHSSGDLAIKCRPLRSLCKAWCLASSLPWNLDTDLSRECNRCLLLAGSYAWGCCCVAGMDIIGFLIYEDLLAFQTRVYPACLRLVRLMTALEYIFQLRNVIEVQTMAFRQVARSMESLDFPASGSQEAPNTTNETSDNHLNVTDMFNALTETPQDFATFTHVFSSKPNYDYFYCGSSLYGNLSP
nr:probable polygalacturonase [Ipomoea batatas]